MPTPPLSSDNLVQSFLRAADERTVGAVVIYAYRDGAHAVSKLKSNRPPAATQAMLVTVMGERAKIATDNMDAMRAMLLKLEWIELESGAHVCPSCNQGGFCDERQKPPSEEHAPDCELAALLARIKTN